VLTKSANFNTRIKPIAWNTSASDFKAWCSGTTGYPIVDAGMRQLNTTGYMHNRARLITANFLNRILNIDWRKGEHYYAQQLTDYDPAINNGNWQWIASTGVDPKPYNQRLFNPWLQSQKFDPQAEYIKKWVPELRDVPATHIHHWSEYAHLHSHATKYPQPIVDYEFARKRSLSVY
jgi:deoxyribodipyrimidine photo-lyase